jgi:hypothetical protein
MGLLTEKAKKLLAMTASPAVEEARTAAFLLAKLIRESGAIITFPGDGGATEQPKPRPAARSSPPRQNVQTPPRPPPAYATDTGFRGQAAHTAYEQMFRRQQEKQQDQAAHTAYEQMFRRQQEKQQDQAAANAWAEDFINATKRTSEAWKMKEKVEAEKRRKDREDAEREEVERRAYKHGKPVPIRAKHRGSCHCCGMNIEVGDKVLWVKGHGVTHEYCKLYWLNL